MKKVFLPLLIGGLMSLSYQVQSMQKTPDTIERFKEMAIQFTQGLPELWNTLSPEERVFIYYMYRAGLPGNRILADQNHRAAVKLIELCEFIIENSDTLKTSKPKFNVDAFLNDIEIYLIYLWTNHGQYFAWEHINQKRTPERIGLSTLTRQNFLDALIRSGYKNVIQTVSPLLPSMFDADVEPTLCMPGSINKSAVNIYAPNFTDKDYDQLPEKERTGINSYFYIGTKEIAAAQYKSVPEIEKYKLGGKYSEELDVAVYWLNKAHEHAEKYPQYFDKHLVKGLDYLIQFFKTGDEELFKEHSIEWAQQQKNGNVDYTLGFIETYDDPKANVGSFQMDVTIKAVDMKKLNAVLPDLEKQLPFPKEYQREDISKLPNASVNTIAFSSGHLGPIVQTAAYCLPNYPELRSKYGSKQIMYKLGKKIGEILHPDAYRRLFNLKEKAAWLKKHDPEGKLAQDLWMVHCILHETLGHGSGRLDVHTFKEGDNLTIGDKTYKVGDTIEVTSENLSELLDGQRSALEELRAEIIALYTSIAEFDALNKAGLYKDWPDKIGKEKLIEESILDMMNTLIRRLYRQDPTKKEISGAHALANSTITHYILANGGASLEREQVELDGKKFTVIGYKIIDLEKVLASISALMIKVQELKSTGDGQEAKKLIDAYGRYVHNVNDIKIVQENTNFVNQGLKATARVYPRYIPVEKDGKIVDIKTSWPSGIVEQWQEFKHLQVSKR